MTSNTVINARVIFTQLAPKLDKTQSIRECFLHDTTQTISLDSLELKGGLLLKVIAVSLDPFMRVLMNGVDDDLPAYRVGKVINGFAVARVVRSEHAEMRVGQIVHGFMDYQTYIHCPGPNPSANSVGYPWTSFLNLKPVNNEYNLPLHYFIGVLGMPGQTAYYALKDISNPKPGETIYVSAGLGAVGHLIVQLAKNLGLKVIASVGSDSKVELVLNLGADHAFNYHTRDVQDELKKHGPTDIFIDSVGGPTLEAALDNMNEFGRIVINGMVSQYEDKEKSYGIKNLWMLKRKRIRMEGYTVSDHSAKYESEFFREVAKLLAHGKLRYLAHISKGFGEVGSALEEMMKGGSVGKSLVVVDDSAL